MDANRYPSGMGCRKGAGCSFSPFAGCSADEDAGTLTISLRCGEKKINTQVQGKGTTDAWNKFVAGSADNVLLDFLMPVTNMGKKKHQMDLH